MMHWTLKGLLLRGLWWLKQLWPHAYDTLYEEKGALHFCHWRMWLGRSYDIQDVIVQFDYQEETA